MTYREPPRHARPLALPPGRPPRAAGLGRSIAPAPAAQRLARWIPVLWWISFRTIGPTLPGALADDTKLAGAAVTIVLIIVVETWISVRQRRRPTVAAV
jgi:hypothetical protein